MYQGLQAPLKTRGVDNAKYAEKCPTLPGHFEQGCLPKFDKTLSRDNVSRQLLKICYSCNKGFCKRKGRRKAGPVANAPGRYVCQKCTAAMLTGKTNNRLKLATIHTTKNHSGMA
jgi:hypothetical protein